MNIDQAEKDKFNKIAEEWWDPSGKFAPLHKINPLRSNSVSYTHLTLPTIAEV